MILVTGATGQVGYRVVEGLEDAGAEATAMVRVQARAVGIPPKVGTVVASLEAPPPPELLQEFDRIFLISPAHEQQVELEVLFIDAIDAPRGDRTACRLPGVEHLHGEPAVARGSHPSGGGDPAARR
jgi:uncharacterized protein YbjT (DUF2867 family)